MAAINAGPEIDRLIQLLARLPGLGPRSARRAALFLIKKREQIMAPLTAAMQTAFVLLFLWKGARADENVVYGPRFAIYTPVVQMADGAPALDAAAAVRENANAIDALCRLALSTYDTWRTTAADASLRVLVDGEERAVSAGGTFDGRGAMTLLRLGSLCTRVARGEELPFSDRRFA